MSQHVCPSKGCNKGVTEFPLTYLVTRIQALLEHAYWRVLSQNTFATITIIPRAPPAGLW